MEGKSKKNWDDVPVDVVITWVDGNDPEWQKEKASYTPGNKAFKAASGNIRYRDWENLQYLFRGIETFMPWVNRVFFVTWGHVPNWLDTTYEKLRIVRHDEFIPEAYRPTFNSNTIELNLHRIPDLSERFINFNDDMFVIGPTKKDDFFENGLPKTAAIVSPYPITPQGIACTEVNNLEVINTYFSTKDIKKNLKKWINVKYGKKMLRTMLFMNFGSILGIYEPHTPLSLRKSVLELLWEKQPDVFENTSKHKFRTKEDINIWLIRQWQIMTGEFVPRSMKFEKLATLPKGEEKVLSLLKQCGDCRLLCMNDSLDVDHFEEMKEKINGAFAQLLPEKSKFEL